MKPWRTVAASDGKPSFILRERNGEYLVQVDGKVLMGSRRHGSEEEMARLGCERLRTLARPRVLVGGLGFGFTLRAALDVLPQSAEVVVAELSSAIIEWNRGEVGVLAKRPLEDARVTVHQGDVRKLLDQSPGVFDALLLDVDNGPYAVTASQNATLYDSRGVQRMYDALKKGGTVVVWSAGADERFLNRMKDAGFRARAPWVQGHVLFVGER